MDCLCLFNQVHLVRLSYVQMSCSFISKKRDLYDRGLYFLVQLRYN